METVKSKLLAVSRAGHDKDSLYVVLAEDGPYYWLADGKSRTLAKPKKKKKIHVQIIKHLPEELLKQMESINMDADLRRILKAYRAVQEN